MYITYGYMRYGCKIAILNCGVIKEKLLLNGYNA